ncbi:hypothetical protein LSO9J_120007 [Candidatus Liberibacter solanacearum]
MRSISKNILYHKRPIDPLTQPAEINAHKIHGQSLPISFHRSVMIRQISSKILQIYEKTQILFLYLFAR